MRSSLPLPDPADPDFQGGPEPERHGDPDDPVLGRSVKLRAPVFEDGATVRQKASRLEWFILHSTEMHGELAELRLRANVDLKGARREWADMQGYQARAGDKTRAGIEDAKRKTNRPLAHRIEDAQWLVDRCAEEMSRLSQEFNMVSRAYTVITG